MAIVLAGQEALAAGNVVLHNLADDPYNSRFFDVRPDAHPIWNLLIRVPCPLCF